MYIYCKDDFSGPLSIKLHITSVSQKLHVLAQQGNPLIVDDKTRMCSSPEIEFLLGIV